VAYANTKRKLAEDEVRKHRDHLKELIEQRTAALEERIKELKCLYAISTIYENRNISLEGIFQTVSDLIPPGWQYPEITCSRIIFDHNEYKTENFKKTTWKQSSKISVNGEQTGTIEVYYLEERPKMDEGPFLKEEKNLINAIAEHLGSITEHRQSQERIKASLKEKKILLSEIHHRVKNNLQVIVSLLRLQSDKTKGTKYADLIKESINRVLSMALVHEQLYQSKDFSSIDFDEYISDLVSGLLRFHGVDTNIIEVKIECADAIVNLDDAIPCGLIINELVTNCLEYAFPCKRKGKIDISFFSISQHEFELKVCDNGVGIPDDFDIRNTESMGLHLVRHLAEGTLEGEMKLDRTKGTKFHFKFRKSNYNPRI